MPSRRSSLQRSPSKRDHATGMPRRSSVGAGGMIGPTGADLSRFSSARFERASPTKVVVPVRLVRSNTSANHSTSRRRNLMITPPRKAHPSEFRYSNQSWKERRQKAEVEDLSSVTMPVESITNHTSLVGALAQSARSSSNKSVLTLVQAASATVAAITNSAPASISENKEETSPSSPSPVNRIQQQQQPPPSLPLWWRRALRGPLVAADVLCIAANSVRLWTRLSAPTTRGFQAVLPASVFAMTQAERAMGGALWEVSFAIFHSVSILRLLVGGSGLLARSNRVVPLNAATSNSMPIQRIKISSQSSATVAVALQDRATAAESGIKDRGNMKMSSRDWLRNALCLRMQLVAYGDVEGVTTEAWTRGSTMLLLANWVLQLCIAAGMSVALPMSSSTPHEFFVTLTLLNMWVLPTLSYTIRRFRSHRLRAEIDHFFHLIWVASSFAITIIGIAVVPLAVFHHQYRGSYNASEQRLDDSKHLDPVWMGRASLAMEWLVTTSAGAAALRVITGMCVLVTSESLHAAIAEDIVRSQRGSTFSQQSRQHSNPLHASAQRKTSLTGAIPGTASDEATASESKWLACCKVMQKAASPSRVVYALAPTLGVIALAGHSSSSSSGSLTDSCVLQLRPWFDARPTCAMLELDCSTDATTKLDDLLSSALPASATPQLKFLLILHCARLQITPLLAQMQSIVALTLSNTTVISWAAPLSYPSHPNLRAVTLADATITSPFLDAQMPPLWLGELLACGSHSAYPAIAVTQSMRMPLLEETRISTCDFK